MIGYSNNSLMCTYFFRCIGRPTYCALGGAMLEVCKCIYMYLSPPPLSLSNPAPVLARILKYASRSDLINERMSSFLQTLPKFAKLYMLATNY